MLKGRLYVSMSDKPFDAKACDIGGKASATNGLSDIETHIKNALCNRPLIDFDSVSAKSGVSAKLKFSVVH
jgi:hypothetical protein